MRATSLGLRARMTASYVVVTAAAVVLVEGIIAAVVIPSLMAEANLAGRVRNTAGQYAAEYSDVLTKMDISVTTTGTKDEFVRAVTSIPIGQAGAELAPGQERDLDEGVLIPRVDGMLPGSAPMSLALLLSPAGQVWTSSYPGRYAPGTEAQDWLPGGWAKGEGGVSQLAGGRVAWAAEPVLANPKILGGLPTEIAGKGKGSLMAATMGYVYVQVPIPPGPLPSPAALASLLQPGLLMLLAVVPVGVVFGLLTTRATIRRLRRLAAGTLAFAAGDLSQRVPESNEDEVGQLERHFNRMAERLAASMDEQRLLAGSAARAAERSRISRDLHDSISQDLFSMSALAGGLRRALPADSAVRPQLDALDRTVTSTIQEMRALLLELRPTALEEKGLVPALTELCQAYEARVGVRVRADLEPVGLGPAAEQTVFRIAQEGLSNAVRHSEAAEIDVRLRRHGAEAELTVADDGRGIAPDAAGGHGLGLKLMSERVRELGGTLAVESEPGRGTALRVLLPA